MIELIREMLYAALALSLADVFVSSPCLLTLLKTDPPRAYFGAVALAILSVSASPSSSPDNVVMGVRGVPLTLADCPVRLHSLMSEFSAIGRGAAHIEEEDTMEVIRLVNEGREGEMVVSAVGARAALVGAGGSVWR